MKRKPVSRLVEPSDELAAVRRYMVDLVAAKTARLPSEPELCRLLGLRRNRVRKALRTLEAQGLIWRRVGKGTFIGQPSLGAEDLQRLVNPQDAFEARLVIEPTITSFAAQRATSDDLQAMRQCLVELRTRQNFYLEWRIWRDRLHRLIACAARNPMLLGVVDLIFANTEAGLIQRMEHVFSNTPLEHFNRELEAIVGALEDRDPVRAESLMRAHLLGIKRRLFGDQ